MLIPLFSALRLAKFNIDTRQSNGFIGLPTPANALFFISIPFMLNFQPTSWVSILFSNTNTLAILCVVMSTLLVTEIPLLSLKFQTFSWQRNKMRYILLFSSIVLLSIFHFVAMPIILLLYPILSIINKSK